MMSSKSHLPIMDDPKDRGYKVLAVSVYRSVRERPTLYDAVRGAWRINVNRAKEADLIFAMDRSVCLGVFVATSWIRGEAAQFSHLTEDELDRWGFHGGPAVASIQKLYKDKQLPAHLKRKRGSASPVLYLGAW